MPHNDHNQDSGSIYSGGISGRSEAPGRVMSSPVAERGADSTPGAESLINPDSSYQCIPLDFRDPEMSTFFKPGLVNCVLNEISGDIRTYRCHWDMDMIPCSGVCFNITCQGLEKG